MNKSEHSEPERKQKKNLPRSIEALIVVLIIGVLCALLIPAVKQAREIADIRAKSRLHLKYLDLAIANYSYGPSASLPTSSTLDQNGKPLHGWMTSLLPYIDEPAMASEIDYKKPWNAPENKKVFSIIVPAFLNSHIDGHKINPNGYGLTHISGSSHLFRAHEPITIDQISEADGLANTIMLGEINSHFPPWGSTINTRDPAKGLHGGPTCFGSPGKEGAYFLFADGRVHFMHKDTDPSVLKAISTPAGGEVFPLHESN